MQKLYDTIVIYKNKLQINAISVSFVIMGVVTLIELMCILKEYTMNIRILMGVIACFIIAIAFFCIAAYVMIKDNKKLKNTINIKENGNIFNGEVIHIIREKRYNYSSSGTGSNDIYTYFIVKFKDKNMNERFIITKRLPQDFDHISINNQSDSTTNISNKEIFEYFGEGFITFDEEKASDMGIYKVMPSIEINGNKLNSGKPSFKYSGDISKNYDGNITCRVYEKDKKIVIDDYEGVNVEKKTDVMRYNYYNCIFYNMWFGFIQRKLIFLY